MHRATLGAGVVREGERVTVGHLVHADEVPALRGVYRAGMGTDVVGGERERVASWAVIDAD